MNIKLLAKGLDTITMSVKNNTATDIAAGVCVQTVDGINATIAINSTVYGLIRGITSAIIPAGKWGEIVVKGYVKGITTGTAVVGNHMYPMTGAYGTLVDAAAAAASSVAAKFITVSITSPYTATTPLVYVNC